MVKYAHLETKNQKEMLVKSKSVVALKKYQATDGKSALSSKDAQAIIKFILPVLTPKENISYYNIGPKAISRLGSFAENSKNKITWESDMERYMKEDEKMHQ